jgi:phenylpyruvate tautomerase PptA (4-oxalocrotonate tautomerase family)
MSIRIDDHLRRMPGRRSHRRAGVMTGTAPGRKVGRRHQQPYLRSGDPDLEGAGWHRELVFRPAPLRWSWRRIAQTRDQMPTYACSAAAGRLTPAQKVEIVQCITAIHHEETGAPRYFVQVIFYDIAHANHYIAGQLAPAGQMWIRGDIRDGRSEEQKSRMLSRILQEVSRIGEIAEEEVWVYLSDIPAQNMAEYARVLPVPGAENAWFATLPATLRERLGPLA